MGLSLAHFGRIAFEDFQAFAGYDKDFSSSGGAAAEIMRGVQKNAPNARAGLVAELGQSILNRSEGASQVVPAVFDRVIDESTSLGFLISKG